MTQIVSIHSFIDVITNSSSVIYTWVGDNSVEGAYDLLNEILKVAGSDKKATDLFDVEIDYDWDDITERFLDAFDDEDVELEERPSNAALIKAYEDFRELSYPESRGFLKNVLSPLVKNYLKDTGKVSKYTTNWLGYGNSSLRITAKDESKSTMNIWDKFFSLFDQEGAYDG